MGMASSHNCCTNAPRTSSLSMHDCAVENQDTEGEIVPTKALKLDPRSPTIGIYRTPIENISFQAPVRNPIENNQKNVLKRQEQDNTIENDYIDSDQSSLTQVTMQNTDNIGCQGFVNFSYDDQSMSNDDNNTPIKVNDPRSPTSDIARTPIQKKPGEDLKSESTVEKFSMDPRSPSENVFRTPLALKEVEEKNFNNGNETETTDPRSPLNDGIRTPITAFAPGNLRRTVLLSNALLASPNASPNVKPYIRQEPVIFNDSGRSSQTSCGDCSEVSLIPNVASPQHSLSGSLTSISSDYDIDDKECSNTFDLDKNDTEFTISDLTKDISKINTIKKAETEFAVQEKVILNNADDESCTMSFGPWVDMDTPDKDNICTNIVDDSFVKEFHTNFQGNNAFQNKIDASSAECNENPFQIAKEDIEDVKEFIEIEKEDNEVGEIEYKKEIHPTDMEEIDVKPDDDADIEKPNKSINQHHEIMITKQMLTESQKISNVITVKTVENDISKEPAVFHERGETTSTNVLIPSDINIKKQQKSLRQVKSLIPKRSRSCNNDNRSRSPVIIIVSPNPGVKELSKMPNNIYSETNKPRSWSLSDASIKQESKKASRIPRQLSGPADRKSELKSKLPAPPRSPLAALDNSMDCQGARGRNRFNYRSKVPRYQGTPPNVINKSLSISRLSSSSQSSIFSGKEN